MHYFIGSYSSEIRGIMPDEMTRQNTSKFAIFYIYENPKLLFPFFISCDFIFFPNECLGLICGHALGKKIK